MLDWSPEQIAGWLRSSSIPMTRACACPMRTIYRSLFIPSTWALKKELMDYLRSKRRMRRSRRLSSEHVNTPEGRSSMRFPSANDLRRRKIRAIPGSLGRRSAGRWEEQLHCDISGAAFPFPHAG